MGRGIRITQAGIEGRGNRAAKDDDEGWDNVSYQGTKSKAKPERNRRARQQGCGGRRRGRQGVSEERERTQVDAMADQGAE
jgi:hypothetical protein